MIPLYDPFDAAGNIITDPFTRPILQCNGVANVICPNRIDAIAKANIALLPSPTIRQALTTPAPPTRTPSAVEVPGSSSTKGDYVFSEKHRVSALDGARTLGGPAESGPSREFPTVAEHHSKYQVLPLQR